MNDYNLLAALRPDMDAELDARLHASHVPTSLHNGIANYLRYGRMPGGFLTAAIQGDLFKAATSADLDNRAALGDIALFLVWHVPAAAFGSPMRVERWARAAKEQNPDLIGG